MGLPDQGGGIGVGRGAVAPPVFKGAAVTGNGRAIVFLNVSAEILHVGIDELRVNIGPSFGVPPVVHFPDPFHDPGEELPVVPVLVHHLHHRVIWIVLRMVAVHQGVGRTLDGSFQRDQFRFGAVVHKLHLVQVVKGPA